MFVPFLSQPHPKKKNSRARKKQYKPLANARINVGESQPVQGYREQAKDIKWRWPWPFSTFLFGSNILAHPHHIHASSTSLFAFLFVFHASIPPPDVCLARLFVIRHSLFVRLIVVRSKPVRVDHVPLLCSTMLFVFCQGFTSSLAILLCLPSNQNIFFCRSFSPSLFPQVHSPYTSTFLRFLFLFPLCFWVHVHFLPPTMSSTTHLSPTHLITFPPCPRHSLLTCLQLTDPAMPFTHDILSVHISTTPLTLCPLAQRTFLSSRNAV